MKLIKLKLTNFQGGNDTITPDGDDLDIYADNAVGKTRINSAFTWLVYGKDALDRSDFAILPLDSGGKRITDVTECEVEGVFDLDGKLTTLKKVYAEKWTKPRGQAQKVFSGSETKCYVNSVPVKVNEYKDSIDMIAGREETFKLLTNPRYFAEVMHWQKRRELLLKVCGDVSDEQVIASNSKLASLPGILEGRKLEDHKKMVTSSKANINKELALIPSRIAENTRHATETGNQADRIAIDGVLKNLRISLREREHALSMIETGGAVAEKELELKKVQGQIADLEREQRNRNDDAIRALNAEVRELLTSHAENGARVETINKRIAENEAKLTKNVETGKRIKASLETIKASSWEGDNTCPTCKQELPEEQIEEAKATFNRNKSELIESKEAEMVTLRDEWTDLTAKIKADRALLAAPAEDLSGKIAELQGKIGEIQANQAAYKESPEYTELARQGRDIGVVLIGIKESKTDRTEPLKTEIKTLGEQISENENKLAEFTQAESATKRIEELKGQEKHLSKEFERLESELFLCEEFARTQARMLDTKINSRFEIVKFKLFEEQVNGGTNPICEVMVNGIPYSEGLNNGARIQAGMDIIRTLQEHEGFWPCVFVDNRESITKIPAMKCQVISLIVSASDPVLRMEVA